MHIAHVALHILFDVWLEVVNLMHFLCSALCAKMIRNSQGFGMPQLLGVQLKKLLKILLFRKLWISVLWNWACKLSGPSLWRSLWSRHFPQLQVGFGGASLASSDALPVMLHEGRGLGSKCYLVYCDTLVFLGIGWNGKRADFPLEIKSVIVECKTRKKSTFLRYPSLIFSGLATGLPKLWLTFMLWGLETEEWCLCCVLNLQTSGLIEISNSYFFNWCSPMSYPILSHPCTPLCSLPAASRSAGWTRFIDELEG